MNVEEARKAATEYMKANGSTSYAMRSCWNCNAAHEHLKDANCPIVCFSCGHWFFKGVQLTEAEESSESESDGR
jgi:PHP family Zn ribbon phosphoesterase